MKLKSAHGYLGLVTLMAAFYWGIAPPPLESATNPVTPADPAVVRTLGIPDINGSPNWAYSPLLQKFVDTLPGICGAPGATNNLGQCIPAGVPSASYPNSDYYEIELVQYREQMHSGLPPLSNTTLGLGPAPLTPPATPAEVRALKMHADTVGGTLLRGYRQTNTTNEDALTPHYLGVAIVAQKDKAVRIKFTNSLPAGVGGNLFIPTDTTVMGSGPGPTYIRPVPRTAADPNDAEVCQANPADCFTQNRADLHLHGGHTPWISDGTAHQWITPAAEFPGGDANYSKGVSVAYVPDMWFDASGNTIAACAGKTFCTTPGATNNPGNGSQTYYYTNNQSARLLFYHDHAWGITRLGVYAGEAAPYIITDPTEASLSALIPDAAHTIPLVIQDKTFVNASTILNTDPTWIWGSEPGTLTPAYSAAGANPVTGDLWWPHVYVPAQNPEQLDGINDFGRWHYGPWFWPPTDVTYGPVSNPYANPPYSLANQPSQIPSIPNPSWGAEAFLDTPVINGTAYPKLNVDATTYRFRILNAAHDRFWNLQLYVADAAAPTEVFMIPAVPATAAVADNDGFDWPLDGREGGVPDPSRRGPAMVQIATEGGFLPAPVVLRNRPVNWNVDPTTFTAGLVLQQNQGGGTLILGPAERADVIVDFSQFAGKTLILYNDSPAPFPALDPHYDYYTNSPVYADIGGAPAANPTAPEAEQTPTLPGFGPNTRTIMQIVVGGAAPNTTPGPVNAVPANLADLQTAFKPVSAGGLGVFDKGQEPIIVGQSAYNENYGRTFPTTYPNWGLSRIIDTSISFMNTSGGIVTAYPMEPKAIQDEMGEVFDDFGRMSAKLGLEMAKTTAGIQTFILQNFVDPPTEIVARDQVQIWKITHNGVDTHPVHFHLFEVQLLNRVGWDGFIYLPDANELGWKDTVRVSPLQDTIVALRPAKIPTPFNLPNSMRPLNPAYPLGATDAGFTNLDPLTGELRTTPVVNEVINFGHEYLWHCHILSHEEQDMMRVIVANGDSLLYTDNGGSGFWQWNRGDWSQIAATDPSSVVASGTHAYAKMADGLYEWNGYTWRRIHTVAPTTMVASTSGLYANYAGFGLYFWNGSTWTRINSAQAVNMAASGSNLYASFAGFGVYFWNGTVWTRINATPAVNMVASESSLYANFAGFGLYSWNGTVWTRLNPTVSANMVASGSYLYANFAGFGLYQWNGLAWLRTNATVATAIAPSGPNLYASFTGYGLYKWNGGLNWTRIHTSIPDNITASGSILYANFTGGNVQKYELGTWSPLLNTTPVTGMVAGF